MEHGNCLLGGNITNMNDFDPRICFDVCSKQKITADEKVKALMDAGFGAHDHLCSGLECGECELDNLYHQGKNCRMTMALSILNYHGYDIVKIIK